MSDPERLHAERRRLVGRIHGLISQLNEGIEPGSPSHLTERNMNTMVEAIHADLLAGVSKYDSSAHSVPDDALLRVITSPLQKARRARENFNAKWGDEADRWNAQRSLARDHAAVLRVEIQEAEDKPIPSSPHAQAQYFGHLSTLRHRLADAQRRIEQPATAMDRLNFANELAALEADEARAAKEAASDQ